MNFKTLILPCSRRYGMRSALSVLIMKAHHSFDSSPPNGNASPRHDSSFANSSSPGLPSIHELISQSRKTPRLNDRGGQTTGPSRASEIGNGRLPPKQQITLPTLSDLSDSGLQREHNDSVCVIEALSKPAPKVRKPRTRKPKDGKSKVTAAASDRPLEEGKAGTSIQDANQDFSKQGEAAEYTLPDVAPVRRKTRRTGTKSDHFKQQSEIESCPKQKKQPKEPKKDLKEPLYLEPAPSRRLDWTPPPQTKSTFIDLGSDTSLVHDVNSSHTKSDGERAQVFRNLSKDYGCSGIQPEVVAISDEDSSFLKKRKLIEYVPLNGGSKASSLELAEKSPTKQKAPKKKARTITDLATSAYLPKQADGLIADPGIPTGVPDGCEVLSEGVIGVKGKGKAKAKPRKTAIRAPKQKSQPPKPVLLSPTAALKQVANQNFVFGTSSQLVKEHLPALINEIQATAREPTAIESDPFATPINSDSIEPGQQKSKLWEAGARDEDGGLFDIEIVDLADDSNITRDPFGYFGGMDESSLPALPDATLPAGQEKDVMLERPLDVLSEISPSPKRFELRKMPLNTIDVDDPFSSDISVSTDVYKPKKTVAAVQRDEHEDSLGSLPDRMENANLSKEGQKQEKPRPEYEKLTDGQLSKEIARFGFKAVKRRAAMIALLDQCWQSAGQDGTRRFTAYRARYSVKKTPPRKKKAAEGSDGSDIEAQTQEPPPSAQPIEAPKRPRGRPRKNSLTTTSATVSKGRQTTTTTTAKKATSKKKETTTVPSKAKPKCKATNSRDFEIPDSASDSDSDASISSSSSGDGSNIDMSIISAENEADMSLAIPPDDDQQIVFNHIREAVMAAPRSTDAANPSWHEKMLLYDPIILEDFTAWLNSGQLSRAGYDDEISPEVVKKWCESNSVCCLWKVNLHGKERKRF